LKIRFVHTFLPPEHWGCWRRKSNPAILASANKLNRY
jgi:hypothetical protein